MIISILNTKGGIGKTVTTLHLGAALATQGRRVLLVDLDLNHYLSTYLDPPLDGAMIEQVLVGEASVERAAVEARPGLWLIPATPALEATEVRLQAMPGGELRLRHALASHPVWTRAFDYIFLDCHGGLSIVTRNALLASAAMIIPVNSESAALYAARETLAATANLGTFYAHEVRLLGILLTRYRNATAPNSVAANCARAWPAELFKTRIRQSERMDQMAIQGQLVGDLTTAAGGAVSEDYEALAEEVIQRCETTKDSLKKKVQARRQKKL